MKEPQKSNKRPIISPLSELPARLMPLGLQVQKGQPLDDTVLQGEVTVTCRQRRGAKCTERNQGRAGRERGQGEEPSAQRGTEEEGLGGKEEAGRVRAASQAPKAVFRLRRPPRGSRRLLSPPPLSPGMSLDEGVSVL